jgi:DNA-directed RNA polymerase specialized sigma24 family protein
MAATFRLETLNEKKALYFSKTQPKASQPKEVMVSSSRIPKDTFLEYTQKIEDIEREIEIVKEEIEILKKYLNKMESSLRGMKEPLTKIFVAKYIDGLNVTQICIKVHYSKTQVYRFLQTIHSILKDGKKWEEL